MKIIKTSAKAALLSSALLTIAVIGIVNPINFYFILIPFVSIIITFIISVLMIVVTIVPFDILKNKSFTNKAIFNTYFPFYAISFFTICSLLIINFNLDEFYIMVFSIAYLTAMPTWIWFFKPSKKIENEK